jgi:hypothetical protein
MKGNTVTLDPCIPEDSLFGQQVVTEALSVGAVSPDNNFTVVEPYSSRGPVTIKYPEPELRQKPDVSAPDAVTVSAGSHSVAFFSGTSASAPHVAGLGCLLWSSNPDLKEKEVRSGLIEITSPGNLTWDPATGYGVPDARLLIPKIQTSLNETRNILRINYSRLFKPREMEPVDTLVLYPGWNMISIPFPLETGNNTGLIFSRVDTDGHTIWRYYSEKGQWIPVCKNDLLSQMDVIWIFSAERIVLPLRYDDGRQNMTSRHLNPGWNPLGIPGRNTVTACELLVPLGNSWSYILVYDPRIQQYRPAIVNSGTGIYSDARLLYPTEGFWIYMNAPGIIIP